MASTAPLVFAQAVAVMSASVCTLLVNVLVNLDGVRVPALFTAAAKYTDYAGQIGYESTKPMLDLATQDVPPGPVGLPVTIGYDDYVIFSHEPDGTGLSRLILERA
jgi:hypothetical protein